MLLGAQEFLLQPGEVVEFDTRTPHWVGNPGPGAAEALALYGPQGERAHVRVRPGAASDTGSTAGPDTGSGTA